MIAPMKFTTTIDAEGDGYVAVRPELDIASQGDSVDEASANLSGSGGTLHRNRRCVRGRIAFASALSENESAALRLRHGTAGFLCRFKPQVGRIFDVLESFHTRLSMSHAARKLGHIGYEGAIFVAPEDDDFVSCLHDQFSSR
jgi:hypothetical protein